MALANQENISPEEAEALLDEYPPEHRAGIYRVAGGPPGLTIDGTVVSRSTNRAVVRAALKYGGYPYHYQARFIRPFSRRRRR